MDPVSFGHDVSKLCITGDDVWFLSGHGLTPYRTAGVEVMYTVIQSLTNDGRDRSLDYKISGFHVPPGSCDAQVWLSVGGWLAGRGIMARVGAILCCPLATIFGRECLVNTDAAHLDALWGLRLEIYTD